MPHSSFKATKLPGYFYGMHHYRIIRIIEDINFEREICDKRWKKVTDFAFQSTLKPN
jgi:hypothetical protein